MRTPQPLSPSALATRPHRRGRATLLHHRRPRPQPQTGRCHRPPLRPCCRHQLLSRPLLRSLLQLRSVSRAGAATTREPMQAAVDAVACLANHSPEPPVRSATAAAAAAAAAMVWRRAAGAPPASLPAAG
eukprot:363645-Chlamydomonas_euryale.AAC.1